MQIFIDTANIQQIQEVSTWGILDGITTNPSLIKKEVLRLKEAGQVVNLQSHLQKILSIAGEGIPVSLEVTATDAEGMITQGKKLHALFNTIADNVVIKIPVNTDMGEGKNFEGLKAIHALSSAEIPVNATLIFTPEQALLAAKAGASYVSPFVGRIDDYIRTQAGLEEFSKTEYFPSEGWEAEMEDGEEDVLDDEGILSGVDLVGKIVDLFEKHEIDCDIIAASLRNKRQVREVALAGATIGTIPFTVLKEMLGHDKTKEGMKNFIADVVPEYQNIFGGQQPVRQVPVQQSPVQPQQSPPPVQQQPVQQNPVQQRPVSPPPQSPTPSAYDLQRPRPGY